MNPYTIKQELKKLWFRIPGSKTELLKKQILILIVSLLLAALLFMQGTEQQFLLPGNQIQREPIGGVEKGRNLCHGISKALQQGRSG